MKKIIFTLLLLSFDAFCASDALSSIELESQIKPKLIANHENAVLNETTGLATIVKNNSQLSDNTKKEILNYTIANTKVMKCENLSSNALFCSLENKYPNIVGGVETIYTNQLYFKSIADYANWQPSGQKTLDSNCSLLKINFYQTLEVIAKQIAAKNVNPYNGQDLTKMDVQNINKIYENNKVVQPYFLINIEKDRKVLSYNCLNQQWTPVITYPEKEKILDGDCHSSELINKIGLQNICSQ